MNKNEKPKETTIPDKWVVLTGAVSTAAFTIRDAIAQGVPRNEVLGLLKVLNEAHSRLRNAIEHPS